MRKWAFLLMFVGMAFSGVVVPKASAVIFDRQGQKLPDSEVNSDRVAWELLKTEQSARFNGVGVGLKGCSLALVALSKNPMAPAYVLTAAHCFGQVFKLDDVIVGLPIPQGQVSVFLNYFADYPGKRPIIAGSKIAYSSLNGVDLALIQLQATVGQLSQAGFHLYEISKTLPMPGEPVEMIGCPQAGMAYGQNYLHRAECVVGKTANLREALYARFDRPFHSWIGFLQNNCSAVAGTSGAPLISLKTGKIVAVVSTGIDDSTAQELPCSRAKPCEVSSDGRTASNPMVNYASPVWVLASCIDQAGTMNLNLPGCKLPKPSVQNRSGLQKNLPPQ